MDKHSKTLIIVTIFLLLLLIVKSNIIDPVDNQVGDIEKYRLYALQTAPMSGGLLKNTGLLTYRVVRVRQDSEDGSTEILLKENDGGNWKKEILKGEYSGKVRAYLLNFIPVKDINFKGGVLGNGE